MPMISFRCLMCSKTVNVADEKQGETIDCPECSASLNVPAQSAEVMAPVVNRSAPKVNSQEESDAPSDAVSTKSIFRAKRKAQQDAAAAGEHFDSSKFDQTRISRTFFLSVMTILILAIGSYSYYLLRPVKRLVLTDEQANQLLAAVNTRDESSITTVMDEYLDAQTTCTELMGKILRYVDSQEKLEEVMDDLKRLSQIALTQNPLMESMDRDEPNMEIMSLMEEYKSRQMGAEIKLEREVARIMKLNPDLAAQLKDEVAVVARLAMFQN